MGTTQADYQLLAVFIAVAKETSFSKAARQIGITKGTVSRAIARLEGIVGAELLHRTTHSVSLSTAGTALYERAAPHLAALDLAIQKLPERAIQPSGELRMSVPRDFGIMILPSVLSRFALRYPEISFDVRVTDLRADLVKERFDLAIRATSTKLPDSSLSVRKLGAPVLGLFASPAYVARRGEPRAYGDSGHDWVAFSSMSSEGKPPKGFSPRFRSDDFLAIRDLLQEGVGVGPLPRFLAAPLVRAGTLIAVASAVRFRSKGGGYFMIYPSSGQVPRKVTAFRDFLAEHLKSHPIDAS